MASTTDGILDSPRRGPSMGTANPPMSVHIINVPTRDLPEAFITTPLHWASARVHEFIRGGYSRHHYALYSYAELSYYLYVYVDEFDVEVFAHFINKEEYEYRLGLQSSTQAPAA